MKEAAAWSVADNRFHFNAMPIPGQADGESQMESRQDGETAGLNQTKIKRFAPDGNPVHVSVWRQRVRVYFNENKVWDIARALSAKAKYNAIVFFVPNVDAGSEYYLGNVRLAVGAPDTRNKLLTDG